MRGNAKQNNPWRCSNNDALAVRIVGTMTDETAGRWASLPGAERPAHAVALAAETHIEVSPRAARQLASRIDHLVDARANGGPLTDTIIIRLDDVRGLVRVCLVEVIAGATLRRGAGSSDRSAWVTRIVSRSRPMSRSYAEVVTAHLRKVAKTGI